VFSLFLLILLGSASAEAVQEEPYGKIVKEIRISELKWTKEHVILRELDSKVGEIYTEESAKDDLERLDQLDLFSSFDIKAHLDDGEVVLEIEVEETYPWIFFPVISSTDENGLSFGAGVRTLNLKGLNVTMGGTVKFGGQTSVGFEIKDPWLGGIGNHFGLRVATGWVSRRNEVGDFDEETFRLAVDSSSYLGDEGRIGARFLFETLKSDEPSRTLSPDGRDKLPMIAAYIGYDTRDVWSNPTEGWKNELEVSKTFGDANYWTFTVDVRRYQAVKERQTLFLSSLTTLRTGELGVDIPAYHVYTFGGVNSVRGWEFDQRRGKNQFLNVAEYRYTVLPIRALDMFGKFKFRAGLQIAAFADLGSLWDEGDQFKDNFISGFGIGLRALLPGVQMLRLDFGWGQSGAKVYVGFGVFEKADMQRKRVR
jgi:outer membrane protein insertion porin family